MSASVILPPVAATPQTTITLPSSPAATGEFNCTCTVFYSTCEMKLEGTLPCPRDWDSATRAPWPHPCWRPRPPSPQHILQQQQVGPIAPDLCSTALLGAGMCPFLPQGPAEAATRHQTYARLTWGAGDCAVFFCILSMF
jgi:hypothetical protein